MITSQRSGFTLLELMLAVLFIGILASVAVPSFQSYQARSRRSEAFANLQGLARSQVTFKAERDTYFGTNNSYPDPSLQNTGVLGTLKMSWDAGAASNFGGIGWEPEGRVFYSYEVAVDASPGSDCSCTDCFTATAWGDVDGDGVGSAVMFVHPDSAGGICKSLLFSWGAPTRLSSGTAVYDEVAINRSGGEY